MPLEGVYKRDTAVSPVDSVGSSGKTDHFYRGNHEFTYFKPGTKVLIYIHTRRATIYGIVVDHTPKGVTVSFRGEMSIWPARFVRRIGGNGR